MFNKKIFTIIIAIISSIISGVAGLNFSQKETEVTRESLIKEKVDLLETKIDYLSLSTDLKLSILSNKMDKLKDSIEDKKNKPIP